MFWPLFFIVRQPPVGQDLLIIEVSRSHRHTTIGRNPLDKWSARRRDLYLYNTQHSQQTDIKCNRFYSNPQSHQARGHRPTP